MNKLIIKFLILFFIGYTPSVFSQNWKVYKKNDALDCRYFTTDGLHNIYIVTSKNELLKYNKDGSFEARFISVKMGKLGTVDASNPHKVLVYYPDFQTVQLLDHELNSLGAINLNDLGVARVGSVALGDDGNIWISDAGTNRLSIVKDKKLQPLQNAVVPFAGTASTQMIFRNNTIYINVPTKGIHIFDRFGKFIKNLDIKNVDYFQVIDNQLFYTQNGKVNRFNLQSLKASSLKMPEGILGSEPLRLEKKWLFVQKGKTIIIHEEL